MSRACSGGATAVSGRGMRQGKGTAGPPAMPLPLVSVVKASAQDVPRYLDEIGKNAAFEAVTVTPQVGGRIIERHFQDGENLAKGQLAVCDRSAALSGAGRCSAGHACASQGRARPGEDPIRARRGGHRATTRSRSRTTTPRRMRSMSIRPSRGRRAALETAKLNLEYCYIHSPIDGRAGARLVDVGNVVHGEFHISAVDPAARSHLRQLHDYGERLPEVQKQMSSGGLEGGCSAPLRALRARRGLAASSFSTTPCRTAAAR